jgi:membrane-associated phospholipid phosphatase
MSIWRCLVLAACTLRILACGARAEADEIRYDLRVDLPVTLAATAAWAGSEALKSRLAHQDCAWCDRRADGSDNLNALDRSVRKALKWSNIDAGDTASSITGFALMPVASLGLTALAAAREGQFGNFPVDLLLVAEATVLAGDLNQLVKFSAGRERPFVHDLSPDQKGKTAHPSDNNTSFYSGHTSLVFALAASSGTVASMRGYRWAPWVWAGGMTIAATTGYLRIAGDRHYFSDVATGALVGSAIGFAVPYLFHRATHSADRKPMAVTVYAQASSTRATLFANFTW